MQGAVWGPAQDIAQMTDFMRGNNELESDKFSGPFSLDFA
jgi:hypothetical protein